MSSPTDDRSSTPDKTLTRADLLRGGALAGAAGLGLLLGAQPSQAQDQPADPSRSLFAITHGADDPNRAILGLVLAQAALKAADPKPVRVWLTLGGADLAHAKKAAQIRSPIFHAFGDGLTLMKKLQAGGAQFGVCPPCASFAGADDAARVEFVPLRGGDWLLSELDGARAVWL